MYSVETEFPDVPYRLICAYLNDDDCYSLFLATGRFPIGRKHGMFSPLHPQSRFGALLWTAPKNVTAVVEGPEGHSVEFAVPVGGVSLVGYPGILFIDSVGIVNLPLTAAGVRKALVAPDIFSDTKPVLEFAGSLPWKEGTRVSHSRNKRFGNLPIYSRPPHDETFGGFFSPLVGGADSIEIPIIDELEDNNDNRRLLVDLRRLGQVGENRFCFLPPFKIPETLGVPDDLTLHGFKYAESDYVVCVRIQTGNTTHDFLVFDSATVRMTMSDRGIDTRDINDDYRAFLSQATSTENENEDLWRVLCTFERYYLARDENTTRDHVIDALRRYLPTCLYEDEDGDDFGKLLVRQLLLVARMPLALAVGCELKPIPKILACKGNISLVLSSSGRLELRAALAPQEAQQPVEDEPPSGKRRAELQGGRAALAPAALAPAQEPVEEDRQNGPNGKRRAELQGGRAAQRAALSSAQ